MTDSQRCRDMAYLTQMSRLYRRCIKWSPEKVRSELILYIATLHPSIIYSQCVEKFDYRELTYKPVSKPSTYAQ